MNHFNVFHARLLAHSQGHNVKLVPYIGSVERKCLAAEKKGLVRESIPADKKLKSKKVLLDV